MPKDTLTTAQAADLLGVSESHLRLMCRNKDKKMYEDLPGVKRFGRWVWSKDDVLSYMKKHGIKIKAELEESQDNGETIIDL